MEANAENAKKEINEEFVPLKRMDDKKSFSVAGPGRQIRGLMGLKSDGSGLFASPDANKGSKKKESYLVKINDVRTRKTSQSNGLYFIAAD